jgi:phosphoenolpyruvate synthase/pyruvate phosphate dikinase
MTELHEYSTTSKTIVWFKEDACWGVSVASGKSGKDVSLAKMVVEGLPVPPGFVIPRRNKEVQDT